MRSPVQVAGVEPNGLSVLLADLLETRLAAHPRRVRLVGKPLVVRATDIGQVATIERAADRLVVRNGADPAAVVSVRGDAATLLRATDQRILAGVPIPNGALIDLWRAFRRGSLEIRGVRAHPVAAWRLSRLLAKP